MLQMWRNVPVYLQIGRMWPQAALVYRANLVFNLLGVLLQIYLLKVVWTAVYAGRGSVSGISLGVLVPYLTLTNLQLWLLSPFLTTFLQQRVKDGLVALDLTRPVGFLGQLLAQQFGITAGIAPFVVAALPLTLVIGELRLPASVAAAVLYAASLILAYLIVVLLGLLLGLVAFWTFEVTSFLTMYVFLSKFFAGALVPLWFFPGWLQAVANFLPFQAQAFIPVSIYLGQLGGAALVRALAIQVFWAFALYLLARLVWSRARRRIVVQGG